MTNSQQLFSWFETRFAPVEDIERLNYLLLATDSLEELEREAALTAAHSESDPEYKSISSSASDIRSALFWCTLYLSFKSTGVALGLFDISNASAAWREVLESKLYQSFLTKHFRSHFMIPRHQVSPLTRNDTDPLPCDEYQRLSNSLFSLAESTFSRQTLRVMRFCEAVASDSEYRTWIFEQIHTIRDLRIAAASAEDHLLGDDEKPFASSAIAEVAATIDWIKRLSESLFKLGFPYSATTPTDPGSRMLLFRRSRRYRQISRSIFGVLLSEVNGAVPQVLYDLLLVLGQTFRSSRPGSFKKSDVAFFSGLQSTVSHFAMHRVAPSKDALHFTGLAKYNADKTREPGAQEYPWEGSDIQHPSDE